MGDRVRADVLGFPEVDRADVAEVGGKGANLGELSRLEGVRVPAGFCVSTGAFERSVGSSIGGSIDRLARLTVDDREAIRDVAAAIRGAIESVPIAGELDDAIARFLGKLGDREP